MHKVLGSVPMRGDFYGRGQERKGNCICLAKVPEKTLLCLMPPPSQNTCLIAYHLHQGHGLLKVHSSLDGNGQPPGPSEEEGMHHPNVNLCRMETFDDDTWHRSLPLNGAKPEHLGAVCSHPLWLYYF